MTTSRPEPGSPADLAHTDQFAAAVADSTRWAKGLLDGGAHLVEPTGPWARRMLDALTAGGPNRGCATVCAARGPIPLFTIRPNCLICARCFQNRSTQMAGRPVVLCTQCGCLNALRPVIAQRHALLAWGRLCWFCFLAERTASRGRH